jgi:cytoskeletal protein CcmA (bactofilin family)
MNKLYDINLEGIGKVNGGTYKDIKISGIGTILDEITCQEIVCEGVCKAKGSISCNNILVEGTFESYGNIEANDKISISGMMKAKGNIQGREITIDGKIKIPGLLSGDKIKIIFIGKNHVKEIGGEEIIIFEHKKSLVNKILMPNKLISDSIEGDIIELENTECEIVRGKNITIKGGCKIKRIEYTGEISVDENSNVEMLIKVE